MYRLMISIVFVSLMISSCTLPLSTGEPEPTQAVPTASYSPEPTDLELTVITQPPTQEVEVVTELPPSPEEVLEQTPTLSPPASPTADLTIHYMVQSGTPVGTANFLHPESGCNWMGVGGQVFGKDDKPISGLVVEVGGTLQDAPVLMLALTGEATVLGPGGYEIALGNDPVASQETLWLQLFDLEGKPQSEKVYFETYGGDNRCEKNLIVVNFFEVGASAALEYYFPVIMKSGEPGTP